jgi:4-amino-4-deoxy-L-arabinose transferase-like glycosyltransferase
MLQVCLLLLSLGLLALHFIHLRADFPNHSPWVDWAKYTDEGWYGDAAIRHYLRGTWRLPGDFNPAVALPVWPVVEALVFRFTGVGIVAARALTVGVFAGVLVCAWALLSVRAEMAGDKPLRLVFAAAAILLLTASPFVFVFTRMAILEPLLILFVLLSLLAAYRTRMSRTAGHWAWYSVAVGVLVALMIGTKTTAIFLLPSVLWMLWSSAGWNARRMLKVTAVCVATVALLWGAYFAALIHRGLLADFRYLFSANAYTGINSATFLATVWTAVSDGMWIGPLIYPLALLMLLAAMFHRRTWSDPVFVSLAIWAAGYMAFMAYHANFQPRYYLVIAVPLVLLAVRGSLHLVEWKRAAVWGLAPLFLVVVAHEARETLHYVRHPEYTFAIAANQVEKIVESQPEHSHTVLSISGSDLSLMTGLPSICDDFGTMLLEDRVAAYKPGWFVAWNYVEDDKMAALAKFYDLTRVGEFPAMDDPDRNVMIVYRLDPKAGVQPKRRRPGQKLLPTGGESPLNLRRSPVDSR